MIYKIASSTMRHGPAVVETGGAPACMREAKHYAVIF